MFLVRIEIELSLSEDEIKEQTKHTKSFFKGFPMGAYNTDGGDTVERNYTVSSSILDLVVNYLEEAL